MPSRAPAGGDRSDRSGKAQATPSIPSRLPAVGARPLFRRAPTEADILLPASLRHAELPMGAKPAVRLGAFPGHSVKLRGRSDADIANVFPDGFTDIFASEYGLSDRTKYTRLTRLVHRPELPAKGTPHVSTAHSRH